MSAVPGQRLEAVLADGSICAAEIVEVPEEGGAVARLLSGDQTEVRVSRWCEPSQSTGIRLVPCGYAAAKKLAVAGSGSSGGGLFKRKEKRLEVPICVWIDDAAQSSVASAATLRRIQQQVTGLVRRDTLARAGDSGSKPHAGRAGKPASGAADSRAADQNVKEGDHVISFWKRNSYFPATLGPFDKETRCFHILFDDGDEADIEYSVIAKDVVPAADEIGVGSRVLFAQGQWQGQPRWHEGVVEHVIYDAEGRPLYSGRHLHWGNLVHNSFRGACETFSDLPIDGLRVFSNIFDCLDDGSSASHVGKVDVFLSVPHEASGKVSLPSEAQSLHARIVQALKNVGLEVVSSVDLLAAKNTQYEDKAIPLLRAAKLVIPLVCDEYASAAGSCSELTFAKKTLRVATVPVVVSSGRKWQDSTVGLLMSGELWVDLSDPGQRESKMLELVDAVGARTSQQAGSQGDRKPASTEKSSVFLSYCWRNSASAAAEGQVTDCRGSDLCDPRKLAASLEKVLGSPVWLDVKRLHGGAPLFEEIVSGLRSARVVVACISDEYAGSENCRMELQYASEMLRKPVIPVVVGEGDTWRETVVGALVAKMQAENLVDLRSVPSESEFDSVVQRIATAALQHVANKPKTPKARDVRDKDIEHVRNGVATISVSNQGSVPSYHSVQGDHVISFWKRNSYFPATLGPFDKQSRLCHIYFDDGDEADIEYSRIAKDVVPAADEIGVGSRVLFAQGQWQGQPRWHEGVVEHVIYDAEGRPLYSGRHLHWGNLVHNSFRGACETFSDLPIDGLRVFSNIFAALG